MARRGRSTRSTLAPLPSIETPPAAQLVNHRTMRSEWRDPTDLTPSAARSARTIAGYRQFDPLRRCLQRHGDRCGITREHIVAADLLRAWGDGAAIGFSAPRDDGLPVTGVVHLPKTGPGRLAEHRARCWRRFVRVMAIFNAEQRALVTHVVLLNRSVNAWVKEHRERSLPVNAGKVMSALVGCLDMLVEFLNAEVRDVIDRGVEAV